MLHIAWSSVYAHPLPEGHRFPMAKYNLIPEQLIYEGTITSANLFEPPPATFETLSLTHDIMYLKKLELGLLTDSEIRKTGFPFSKALVHREKVIMEGTVQAAMFALKYGVSLNIAGGTHHAFSDRGEGFCLLNDIAIAANVLLHERKVSKILVVDLDVHQGNGTAALFQHDVRVFTFSMHGKKNYPFHKEKSDLDIALEDGTSDEEYLSLLDYHLKLLMDAVQPEFVFFQSGVDIIESDKLGKLNVSIEGCRQRDKLVFEVCKKNKVPVCASMGGGYSPRLSDIVEAHANTFRLAQELFF
ncbi:MAG: histone deacetylase [Flavobacteriales bacterium]|nr:histone deacetylase [Flavobacteriales bacterium]